MNFGGRISDVIWNSFLLTYASLKNHFRCDDLLTLIQAFFGKLVTEIK